MRAVIFLIVFVALAASISMCAQKTQTKPVVNVTSTPTSTPTQTTKHNVTNVTTTATPTTTVTTTANATQKIQAATAKPIGGECLDCHYNPKRQYVPQVNKIPGHLNATPYCIYCHVPNVTKMTKSQITAYLVKLHHETIYAKEGKCSLCHRTISVSQMKNCGNCHAANPFEPSYGNVFAIHSPRGVTCQDCHGHNFIAIHYYHKAFPPQFPIPTNISNK